MKPEGILLTIPARFFKEYPKGEAGFRAVIEDMNREDCGHVWNQTISGIPKHEVLWCYLVFGGKVQYRLNIAGYDKGTKRFVDNHPDGSTVIRTHKTKKWVILCGPVIPATLEIPRRGFQGFRYCEALF